MLPCFLRLWKGRIKWALWLVLSSLGTAAMQDSSWKPCPNKSSFKYRVVTLPKPHSCKIFHVCLRWMYCSMGAYNTYFCSLFSSVWYEVNQSIGQHSALDHSCFAVAQGLSNLWRNLGYSNDASPCIASPRMDTDCIIFHLFLRPR